MLVHYRARWIPRLAFAVGLALGASQQANALVPDEQDYAAYSSSLHNAAEAESRGETGAAVDAYVVAYQSLPPQDRADALGEDVINRVVGLMEGGIVDLHNVEAQRRVVTVVQEHLAEAGRLAPERSTQDLTAALARLQARVDAFEAPASAVEPALGPKLEAEGDPEVESVRPQQVVPPASLSTQGPPVAPARVARGRLWLGLTFAGASTAVAGFGGMGLSLLLHRQAGEEAAKNKDNGFHSETDKHDEDKAASRARAVLIAGSVAAGVGSAAFIAGLVKLRRSRRSARTSTALVPFMGSGSAGAVAIIKF